MNDAASSFATGLKIFDSVSVDGRRGVALGFYAREERTVLVRLDDHAGLIEVPESQLVVEGSRLTAWFDACRSALVSNEGRRDASGLDTRRQMPA
jgi:hypothetical protein